MSDDKAQYVLSGDALVAGWMLFVAVLTWLVIVGIAWTRYRRPDQRSLRFLWHTWVILDARLFRPEGAKWLWGARLYFLAVVVPAFLYYLKVVR